MKHEDVEKQLENYKNKIENISIPEKLLDEAIEKGMKQHKESKVSKKKRRYYLPKWTWAAIIILLAGCVWTVYLIDPVFLRGNPSWESAMQNEYYHEINFTEKKEGINFTLHGVMMDEKNIVSFITIETENKVDYASIGKIQLFDQQGKELIFNGSYGPIDDDDGTKKKRFRHTVDAQISSEDTLKNGLRIEMDVHVQEEGVDENVETFSVPIEVEQIKLAKKQQYEVNETIEIDGQKITIEKIVMYPTRAEVHIVLDSTNTKDILDYTNLQLEDGKGKIWGKVSNGVVNMMDEKEPHKDILYLESSYFEVPEQLFMTLSKVQAVNKNEREIIYSMDEGKIIQAPDNGKLIESVFVEDKSLVFAINTPSEEDFPFGMFSHVLDEQGKELELYSSFNSIRNGKGYYGVELKDFDTLKGNIYIPVQYYPTFLEAEKEIKLQIK